MGGLSSHGMSARGEASAQGRCVCPRSVCTGRGGYLPRGVCPGVSGWGCLPRGGVHHPLVDRMTDRCKNIILPQT